MLSFYVSCICLPTYSPIICMSSTSIRYVLIFSSFLRNNSYHIYLITESNYLYVPWSSCFLSVFFFGCLVACLCVHFFLCSLSVCLSVNLSVSLSFFLYIFLFLCRTMFFCFCLTACSCHSFFFLQAVTTLPSTTHYCYASESCVPLWPLKTVRQMVSADSSSWVNYQYNATNGYATQYQVRTVKNYVLYIRVTLN